MFNVYVPAFILGMHRQPLQQIMQICNVHSKAPTTAATTEWVHWLIIIILILSFNELAHIRIVWYPIDHTGWLYDHRKLLSSIKMERMKSKEKKKQRWKRIDWIFPIISPTNVWPSILMIIINSILMAFHFILLTQKVCKPSKDFLETIKWYTDKSSRRYNQRETINTDTWTLPTSLLVFSSLVEAF